MGKEQHVTGTGHAHVQQAGLFFQVGFSAMPKGVGDQAIQLSG